MEGLPKKDQIEGEQNPIETYLNEVQGFIDEVRTLRNDIPRGKTMEQMDDSEDLKDALDNMIKKYTEPDANGLTEYDRLRAELYKARHDGTTVEQIVESHKKRQQQMIDEIHEKISAIKGEQS